MMPRRGLSAASCLGPLTHALLECFECGGKDRQFAICITIRHILRQVDTVMPRKKRTRGGKPKIAVKRKEEDDQSDVSMCSTTSEVPFSKEEVMARLIEDFKFGCKMESHLVLNFCNHSHTFSFHIFISTEDRCFLDFI